MYYCTSISHYCNVFFKTPRWCSVKQSPDGLPSSEKQTTDSRALSAALLTPKAWMFGSDESCGVNGPQAQKRRSSKARALVSDHLLRFILLRWVSPQRACLNTSDRIENWLRRFNLLWPPATLNIAHTHTHNRNQNLTASTPDTMDISKQCWCLVNFYASNKYHTKNTNIMQ